MNDNLNKDGAESENPAGSDLHSAAWQIVFEPDPEPGFSFDLAGSWDMKQSELESRLRRERERERKKKRKKRKRERERVGSGGNSHSHMAMAGLSAHRQHQLSVNQLVSQLQVECGFVGRGTSDTLCLHTCRVRVISLPGTDPTPARNGKKG